MLQAEDARPTTDAGLAPLMEGLKGNGRRTAVRAIGRLERPEMIPLIAPALNDGVGIRAEAANALAQMARTPAAVGEVQKLLLARAATDASLNTWESWGEIAAALGRLAYDTPAQVAETEAVLLTGLPAPDSMNDVETAALVGSARGLEALARTVRAKKLPPLGERTWDLLRWAATAQRPATDPRSAITRRLAMAALVTGNQATASVIERGLNDADAEVRRFAAAAAGSDARIEDRERILKVALADKEPRVRLEALRSWGRLLQKTSCAPIRAALNGFQPARPAAGDRSARERLSRNRERRRPICAAIAHITRCARRARGMRRRTRWSRWPAQRPDSARGPAVSIRAASDMAGPHVCRSRRRRD